MSSLARELREQAEIRFLAGDTAMASALHTHALIVEASERAAAAPSDRSALPQPQERS